MGCLINQVSFCGWKGVDSAVSGFTVTCMLHTHMNCWCSSVPGVFGTDEAEAGGIHVV